MSRLFVNDTAHAIPSSNPARSLLSFLRTTLGLTGTKEGCGSGDCGACTVLVDAPMGADLDEGQRFFAVNACIAPLGAFAGRSIITVEGLGTPAEPHPVQTAMVAEHGSQCGFCTPGFVMAIAAAQLDQSPFPEDDPNAAAARSIGGNLCRCTGYRPILSAMAKANAQLERDYGGDATAALACADNRCGQPRSSGPHYQLPQSLTELNGALTAGGARTTFVAGGTDLWLEVTQRYRDFDTVIDLSQVPELNVIERTGGRLMIGAAVTHRRLARLFSGHHALGKDLLCPAILHLLERFGSPQVRNRGTLGGNIGNASPIADWPPLLLCLDAELVLGSVGGERRIPLQDYYIGYRKTALEVGEYLLRVELTEPARWRDLTAQKISKRTEDDISSVFGAFHLIADKGQLSHCRIAYGGMAATPIRMTALEEQLLGQPLGPALKALALEHLNEQLKPLSDVRASARYRLAMAKTLLERALCRLEGQGRDDHDALHSLEAVQP